LHTFKNRKKQAGSDSDHSDYCTEKKINQLIEFWQHQQQTIVIPTASYSSSQPCMCRHTASNSGTAVNPVATAGWQQKSQHQSKQQPAVEEVESGLILG